MKLMKTHSVISDFTSFTYKHLLKPILFSFEPDSVHEFFLKTGQILGSYPLTRALTRWAFSFSDPMLEQKVCGITFTNPIGLSEGFDKDANLVDILPGVGFGFHQVGTVTLDAYEGNPQPWLHRLQKTKSIVVYFGLKNIGATKIINKLKNKNRQIPMSISVGKTNSPKTVKTAAGVKDYYDCLKCFVDAEVGDFYTINISCPNTFGGEPFTNERDLNVLLKKLSTIKTEKPVFIKMPINLSWREFDELLKIAVKYKVSGVIIGNLNKDKKDPTVTDKIPAGLKGSLSGRPTWRLSNALISKTYQKYGQKLTIVGVGGVFSGADAYEKIRRGATLVQLITGMIFEGPSLIGSINRDLIDLLKRDGYESVTQAIGAFHKESKL